MHEVFSVVSVLLRKSEDMEKMQKRRLFDSILRWAEGPIPRSARCPSDLERVPNGDVLRILTCPGTSTQIIGPFSQKILNGPD